MPTWGWGVSSFEFRVRRNAEQLVAEQLLGLGQVLVERPRFEQVFEPRLLAVAAVAVRDVNPQQGGGDLQDLLGANEHAEVAGKGLVAGRAAEGAAEVGAIGDLVGDEQGSDRRGACRT